MSIAAVDLVKRYYGSLAPGRRQNLVSLLDPDFVLELQEGFPGGRRRYSGLKEYLGDFLELIYGSLDLEFVPEEFLQSNARIVATGQMKGRATPSAVPFDIPFVHVWTSDGRHLSHARFFTDTAVLKDAIAGRRSSAGSAKSP